MLITKANGGGCFEPQTTGFSRSGRTSSATNTWPESLVLRQPSDISARCGGERFHCVGCHGQINRFFPNALDFADAAPQLLPATREGT